MKIDKNELILIYDSNDLQDRAILAYAMSTKDRVVRAIDIRAHRFTEMQYEQIADLLGLPLVELVDMESPSYQRELKDTDLTDEDILKALKNNDDLFKTPVALYNDTGNVIKSPHELIKEGMIK